MQQLPCNTFNIEGLEAPGFKCNATTDLICQRAAERERSHEASQNAIPGTIKCMQLTFLIDQATLISTANPISNRLLN